MLIGEGLGLDFAEITNLLSFCSFSEQIEETKWRHIQYWSLIDLSYVYHVDYDFFFCFVD